MINLLVPSKIGVARRLEHAAHLPADDAVQADALRGAVRGACLAAKNDWAAARVLICKPRMTLGCRDVLCLEMAEHRLCFP